MEILHSCLHHLNNENESFTTADTQNETHDYNHYINELIDEIISDTRKRKFEFSSQTTEVRSVINDFLNGNYESAKISVERLLRIEKITQERIERLDVEVQKGSLFQALVRDGNKKLYVILKADHGGYLDENDLTNHVGLPLKKKVFKGCVVNFNTRGQVSDVFVSDSNRRMSTYWWQDFLELRELFTSEENTKTAFHLIEKVLNKIRTKSPVDYNIIRNSTVRYFRANEQFDLQDYIDNTFSNYVPEKRNLNIGMFENEILSLRDSGKFDNRFQIATDKLTKRIVNKIPLSEGLELHFNSDIDNFTERIKSFEEADGTKGIKIITDEGYNQFVKENESN